jgi:hypothetical protein
MSERRFGAGPEDFKQAEWLAFNLKREWRYDFTTEKWHFWTGIGGSRRTRRTPQPR